MSDTQIKPIDALFQSQAHPEAVLRNMRYNQSRNKKMVEVAANRRWERKRSMGKTNRQMTLGLNAHQHGY